eukprot:755413-Hanusia_phi.AAC.4
MWWEFLLLLGISVASAAAYTDATLKAGQGSQSQQFSKFGWHPTLERIMGVPKNQARVVSYVLSVLVTRLSAANDWSKTCASRAGDGAVSSIYALLTAQELLRKSVSLGLQVLFVCLRLSCSHRQLVDWNQQEGGREAAPERSMHNLEMRANSDQRRTQHWGSGKPGDPNFCCSPPEVSDCACQGGRGRQVSTQQALAKTTRRHMASMHAALKVWLSGAGGRGEMGGKGEKAKKWGQAGGCTWMEGGRV